ncbi:MAG: RNA-binding protein [Patescibacteria group bacterium]
MQEEEKNKLYVGNLSYDIDSDALYEMFAKIDGVEVVEARVITDKFNGNRSKGFGFVTVKDEEMAQKAIDALNNTEVGGRQIFVNVARPQKQDGFGGGDRNRGGYNQR